MKNRSELKNIAIEKIQNETRTREFKKMKRASLICEIIFIGITPINYKEDDPSGDRFKLIFLVTIVPFPFGQMRQPSLMTQEKKIFWKI